MMGTSDNTERLHVLGDEMFREASCTRRVVVVLHCMIVLMSCQPCVPCGQLPCKGHGAR